MPARARPASQQRSAASGRVGPATIIGRIVVALALIGVWQLFSGRVLPVYAISDPAAVWHSFWGLITSGSGWTNIGVTFKELVLGFGIGIGAGVVLGLTLGYFSRVGAVIEPFIGAINAIPKIALAPILILILGIGTWSDATMAAMMVAMIIFYNIYIGLRSINPELLAVIRLMRANRWHLVRYVYGPSVVGPFFAGIRAAGPFAVLGVVIGEFIASVNGVGHILSSASTSLQSADVYATVVVLILMVFVLNALLGALDVWVSRRLGLSA